MKTRVAKAIARVVVQTIIWSAILAGMACLSVFLLSGGDERDLGLYAWVAACAFTAGLIAFTIYRELTIEGIEPSVNAMFNVLVWSMALALLGGIGATLLVTFIFTCVPPGECSFEIAFVVLGSVPVAFFSGVITFALYELSKRVKIHHLVHHKKQSIALIGLSVLLLGMIPGFVILDSVSSRNQEQVSACDSQPFKHRFTESLETLEYLDDHIDNDEYWVFHDEDNSVWARVVRERSPLSETKITLMGEARELSLRSQAHFSKAWCEKLVDCVRPHQLIGEFWVSGVSFDGEDPRTGNFMERLRETMLPVVQEHDRIGQRWSDRVHYDRLARIGCNTGTESKVTELEEPELAQLSSSVVEVENLDLQPAWKRNPRGEVNNIVGEFEEGFPAWVFVDKENEVFVEVIMPYHGDYAFDDILAPLEIPSYQGVIGKVSPGNYALALSLVLESEGRTYYYAHWDGLRPDLDLHQFKLENVQLDNMQTVAVLSQDNSNLIQRVNEEVKHFIASLQAERQG